jgi:hypothetical protein
VVVPGGDQPIEVKRGLVPVPELNKLPIFPGQEQPPLVGIGLGNAGSQPLGDPPVPPTQPGEIPIEPPTAPPIPTPEAEEAVLDNPPTMEEIVDPAAPPVVPAPVPEPEPEPEEPEPTPTEPTEPVIPEGQCSSDADCSERWAYCPPGSEDELRECARFPKGVAFYINSIEVTEPAAVKVFMTETIQNQIVTGLFSLFVAFSDAPNEAQKPAGAPRNFHLVQTESENGQPHQVSETLPSIALNNAQRLGELSWGVGADTDRPDKEVSLYLRTSALNDCSYAPITVLADVVAQVTSDGNPATLRLTVTGALTKENAQNFRIKLSGGAVVGLDEILEDANIPRIVDSNDDNVPDAWGFSFIGIGREGPLVGDPALAVGNQPCP